MARYFPHPGMSVRARPWRGNDLVPTWPSEGVASITHCPCDQEVDRTSAQAGGIRIGFWVNTSLKTFRLKSVEFSSVGMGTDVPRPLSTAPVAVRNVFVPYKYVRGVGATRAVVTSPAPGSLDGADEQGPAIDVGMKHDKVSTKWSFESLSGRRFSAGEIFSAILGALKYVGERMNLNIALS